MTTADHLNNFNSIAIEIIVLRFAVKMQTQLLHAKKQITISINYSYRSVEQAINYKFYFFGFFY